MENQKKLHLFAIFLVFVLGCSMVYGEPKVPCFFIFGDSAVDSGNNNNLPTVAKANYLPYGIDFPEGPTGRFCNGRTLADIYAERLGFESFIPSFLNVSKSRGSDILKGVNYASGSAGIRPETGKRMGVNYDLGKQVKNHQVIVSRIVEILGSESAAQNHLNKCLYSSVIGSLDYLTNYFSPDYNTSKQYTPEQFAQVVTEEYSQHMMSLYNSGARKVALTGISPVGCLPGVVASKDTNGSSCVESMNHATDLFNQRLESLVHELNKNLTDAKFLYLKSTYGSIKQDPGGFGNKLQGCCKANEYGFCISNQEPCQNRNSRVFYDAFLPTENANIIGAEKSFPTLMKIL